MGNQGFAFGIIDYIIFAVTVLASLGIGVFFAARPSKNTTDEYLMASRSMKIIPVSISLLVSFLSTITLLGNSSEMFYYGGQYWFTTFGYLFAPIIISFTLVPLFHPLQLTSINEYLLLRYKSRTIKYCGTCLQVTTSLVANSVALYGPATMMEAAAGFPEWASILLIGLCATIYTTIGGFKAVIWSDVFQAVIILGGLFAVIGIGIYEVGSFVEVWTLYIDAGRFNISWDPSDRLNIWNTLLGAPLGFCTILGMTQPAVQRYCSLPSVNAGRKCVLSVIPVGLLMNSLASFSGIVLFSYFAKIGCDPLKAGQIKNPNQALPYFVMVAINYPSLPGILMACVFCATLSNLSSAYSSAAALVWDDILRDKYSKLPESRKTLITKLIVCIAGMISTACAFLVANAGGTMIRIVITFVSAIGAPNINLLAQGFLLPRINKKSVGGGALLSCILLAWISISGYFYGGIDDPLPTSIEKCPNSTSNATDLYSSTQINHDYGYTTTYEDLTTPVPMTAMDRFYNIPPYWYLSIAVASGFVTSLLLSLIPGFNNDDDPVHPDLLTPWVRRFAKSEVKYAPFTKSDYKDLYVDKSKVNLEDIFECDAIDEKPKNFD